MRSKDNFAILHPIMIKRTFEAGPVCDVISMWGMIVADET